MFTCVRINAIYNGTDYATISELPEPFNNPDLVVFEEVYKLEYIKLYNECLRKKIPYVVIPHGCLVEIEQRNKTKTESDWTPLHLGFFQQF